jgi:hypothetical protein
MCLKAPHDTISHRAHGPGHLRCYPATSAFLDAGACLPGHAAKALGTLSDWLLCTRSTNLTFCILRTQRGKLGMVWGSAVAMWLGRGKFGEPQGSLGEPGKMDKGSGEAWGSGKLGEVGKWGNWQDLSEGWGNSANITPTSQN